MDGGRWACAREGKASFGVCPNGLGTAAVASTFQGKARDESCALDLDREETFRMQSIIRVAVPVAATIALAACANPYRIEAAKHVSPQGDQFTQSLAQNYSDYTRFESDEMYDWSDADHFAKKTLMAAEGQQVAPEDPQDWDIDNEDWRNDLRAAREALIAAYRDGAREKHP